MRNVIILFFQQSWSLALALALKRTGLGLEDYWPWPRTCCPRTHPWVPEMRRMVEFNCTSTWLVWAERDQTGQLPRAIYGGPPVALDQVPYLTIIAEIKRVIDTAFVISRRSLLIAGDNDEMIMTRSLNVTPKATEQHLINCTQVINL